MKLKKLIKKFEVSFPLIMMFVFIIIFSGSAQSPSAYIFYLLTFIILSIVLFKKEEKIGGYRGIGAYFISSILFSLFAMIMLSLGCMGLCAVSAVFETLVFYTFTNLIVFVVYSILEIIKIVKK